MWQEKCGVILMLCKLVEKDEDKCDAYWPAEVRPTRYTVTCSHTVVERQDKIRQVERGEDGRTRALRDQRQSLESQHARRDHDRVG